MKLDVDKRLEKALTELRVAALRLAVMRMELRGEIVRER